MKLKKWTMICGLSALMFTQVAMASDTRSSYWSNTGTFSGSSGWITTTTTGSKLKQMKTSNSMRWGTYTAALTSFNNPSVKLVNSNGSIRSEVMSVANTGREKYGSNNTGTSGYNYYLYVKPNALQIGTDSYKLQFKNY